MYMSRSTVPCMGRSQRSPITGDQQPLWITMSSVKICKLYSILFGGRAVAVGA